LSKIENYNIEVSDGGSHYVVRIYPRLSQDHPVVFGGDGIYILDASTFKIIEKHYGKWEPLRLGRLPFSVAAGSNRGLDFSIY
jgi:hypothetical protein